MILILISFSNSGIFSLGLSSGEGFLFGFISISSTFLGLLLSSMVKTTERAMTILPLILLPQIMLAGVITKVSNGFVEFISYFTISRWGVEGYHIMQKNIMEENPLLGPPEERNAIELILSRYHESYRNKDIFGDLTSTMELDFLVILGMIIFIIIIIYIAIKNKDSVKT